MSDFIPNSFQVPNIIIDNYFYKMSGNSVKIYLFIVRKTKGWQKQSDGISHSQISKALEIKSHNTIRKSLDELIELSLINEDKTHGKYSIFSLNIPSQKLTNTSSKIDYPPSQKLTTHKTTNTKTTNKTKNKQKEKSLPENLNLEAFNMWCKYKGSTYTQKGETLSANMLSKYSQDEQMKMVENSIMNNYKGLFEIKCNTQKKSNLDLSEKRYTEDF